MTLADRRVGRCRMISCSLMTNRSRPSGPGESTITTPTRSLGSWLAGVPVSPRVAEAAARRLRLSSGRERRHPPARPCHGAASRPCHLAACTTDQLAALVETRLKQMQYRPGPLDDYIAATGLTVQPVTELQPFNLCSPY
jgi:hypothetical protein